jgi:hypothetical protein
MSDKLIEIVTIFSRILERIVDKVFSGRFIFTTIGAILYYNATMTGLFEPKESLSILKDVVIFYFIVKHSLQNDKGAN